MRRDMTRVGQHAQSPGAIGKDKLHRFAGIVRNRKWMHADIADRQRLMAVDSRGAYIGPVIAARGQRTVCQQHGPVEATRTGEYATDVIGVFVRDQYGVDIVSRQTQSLQPARHFARTKSRIDQHASTSCFDQQGVTSATTAERGEAHLAYFNCSCNKPRMRLDTSD